MEADAVMVSFALRRILDVRGKLDPLLVHGIRSWHYVQSIMKGSKAMLQKCS